MEIVRETGIEKMTRAANSTQICYSRCTHLQMEILHDLGNKYINTMKLLPITEQ